MREVAISASPEESFPPEPTPVFSPNRLRFLVVASMAGALLALTLGVRTATTGLRILTLPRTLAARASGLRTSILRMEATRAAASQFVVPFMNNYFLPEPTPVFFPNRLRLYMQETTSGL